ncbi:hypothetical protein [Reichenbachiella faecimaris]|uniref:hypothetical protein n=1 Tax=Reichenbachiella faecimaris TaxID=692418 RepID=UPI00111C29CC|nr:hypothetical protein [Reichenbachiella faecimaris]
MKSNLIAQDVIVTHKGDEINSKIVEIGSDYIKYYEFEFQEGPLRNIERSKVFMIIYENGRRELIKQEIEQKEQSNESYDGLNWSIAVGYGNSYGKTGVRFQYRTGGWVGFGTHVGVGFIKEEGYYGENPLSILASAGFKIFPYKEFYINTQIGMIDVISDLSGSSGTYQKEILYGPSLMIGSDWAWGEKIKYGLNIGTGVSYIINYASHDIDASVSTFRLALDLGFIVQF